MVEPYIDRVCSAGHFNKVYVKFVWVAWAELINIQNGGRYTKRLTRFLFSLHELFS